MDPELALDLVDQVKPSDIEREKAFARLSVMTLEALGQDRSVHALDTIKARGFESKVDLLQQGMSILSGDWSAAELLTHLERIGKARDKLLLIKSWLSVNRDREQLSEVVKYGLELAIRTTDLPLDAAILRALADPLESHVGANGTSDLVGMFDAQMASAAKLGPAVEYVRLQVALARCEVRYDKTACENRLIGLLYEIEKLDDITTKTEAWAWLTDGVSAIESVAPCSSEVTLARDVGLELDNSFVALLDSTADHYKAASGVMKALAHRHLNKAREFISMINTQARRDAASLDLVDTLFEPKGVSVALGEIKNVLNDIQDVYVRHQALENTIAHLARVGYKAPTGDTCLESILNEALTIADAASRCKACASAIMTIHNNSSGSLPDLKARLLDMLRSSWEAIDLGWLRVKTGFNIAKTLASNEPASSSEYLGLAEQLRARLGGLASHDANHAYISTLHLAARAFSGLVKRRVYSKQDLEKFAVLVGALPGFGEQALLWGELAARCARDDKNLCADIVNERVRPLISAISEGDREFKDFVTAAVAPALYEVHGNGALGTISKLGNSYRERALGDIIEFLLRNAPPSEPEDYKPGAGYNIEYSRLLKACEVMSFLESDDVIYRYIEKLIDTITSKTLTVQFTGSQKDEVYRRLQKVIDNQLPAKSHIRHDGYKIIASAQIARYRSDPDPSALGEKARRIPNMADRVLVMYTTGIAISKAARSVADSLLEEAKLTVGNIPADWDRLERLIGFASEVKPTNFLLSKQLLQQALGMTSASGRTSQSLRRIVDLSYRIDPVFAKDLVDKLDDDKARKLAKRQIELLDIKQKLVDEKPAYEELQIASRTEFQRLGAMLLGSLQSDRIDSIRPQAMRPCIQASARQPIRQSYFVMAWIVENAIEKYHAGDKAGYHLRPIYEATLAAAELAAELADRSFTELKAAREHFAGKAGSETKSINLYDREQAIAFLKMWLEDNAKERLVVCDSEFDTEDLLLLQLVRSTSSSCKVDIITNRPAAPPANGAAWDDFYRSQWRDLSEQSPPPTRITMIAGTSGETCVAYKCCIVAGETGIELNDSVGSLGIECPPVIRHLSLEEVEAIEQNVQSLSAGQNDWNGVRVRFSSFSL